MEVTVRCGAVRKRKRCDMVCETMDLISVVIARVCMLTIGGRTFALYCLQVYTVDWRQEGLCRL